MNLNSLFIIIYSILIRNTASSPGIESYTNFTEPYASDWLLTTILGPDYVDNDWSEDPSAPDYGYWIKFIYTVNPNKTSMERSPYSGNSPGGSSQLVSSFSMGLRDQVYLSRIESATHSAEFYYTTTNNKNLVPSEVGSITFKSVNNLYYCRSHQIKGNWTDFINTVINNGVYDDQRIFTAKAEYGNDVQGWYHYDFTIFGNQIQSCTYDINSNITTINETGTPLTLSPIMLMYHFTTIGRAPCIFILVKSLLVNLPQQQSN